jgi:hypothetical protein
MKLKLNLIIFLLGSALLGGCGSGKNDQPVEQIPLPRPVINLPPPVKEKTIPYVYRAEQFKDPFSPVTGESNIPLSSEDVIAPNLGALSLKGIFDDNKGQKVALINAGGFSYTLKGKYLYDNRQRLVKGFTGVIKKDSVIMIAPDNTTKEFKLREKY